MLLSVCICVCVYLCDRLYKILVSGGSIKSHLVTALVLSCIDNFFFNPFPNKPWFLRVCSKSLLKTLWEKEKLLVTSNFSFSNSVFYLLGELPAFFNKFEIVVCRLFQFGRVKNLPFGKGLNFLYNFCFSFDKDLGGLEISMRLRDHLAKYFNEHKKTKMDLYSNHRAMAKLLKEAKRVKKVLSANQEHQAQVRYFETVPYEKGGLTLFHAIPTFNDPEREGF